MGDNFREQCKMIRHALGLSQEYMAAFLGLKGQKAFSRLERKEGKTSKEHQQLIARELGFSSVESLCGFDLKEAIARYEGARRRDMGEPRDHWSEEQERLAARIAELENELSTLKRTSRVRADRRK